MQEKLLVEVGSAEVVAFCLSWRHPITSSAFASSDQYSSPALILMGGPENGRAENPILHMGMWPLCWRDVCWPVEYYIPYFLLHRGKRVNNDHWSETGDVVSEDRLGRRTVLLLFPIWDLLLLLFFFCTAIQKRMITPDIERFKRANATQSSKMCDTTPAKRGSLFNRAQLEENTTRHFHLQTVDDRPLRLWSWWSDMCAIAFTVNHSQCLLAS